jgi:hypothetical protein
VLEADRRDEAQLRIANGEPEEIDIEIHGPNDEDKEAVLQA